MPDTTGNWRIWAQDSEQPASMRRIFDIELLTPPSDTPVPVWRTGRRNPRVIYLQTGPEPDHDNDVMIGSMDTAELAGRVVADVNAVARLLSLATLERETP